MMRRNKYGIKTYMAEYYNAEVQYLGGVFLPLSSPESLPRF